MQLFILIFSKKIKGFPKNSQPLVFGYPLIFSACSERLLLEFTHKFSHGYGMFLNFFVKFIHRAYLV